jgi:hypothetical protein
MSRFAFTYEDPSYDNEYDDDHADWQDAQSIDEDVEDEVYSPYNGA